MFLSYCRRTGARGLERTISRAPGRFWPCDNPIRIIILLLYHYYCYNYYYCFAESHSWPFVRPSGAHARESNSGPTTTHISSGVRVSPGDEKAPASPVVGAPMARCSGGGAFVQPANVDTRRTCTCTPFVLRRQKHVAVRETHLCPT